jgi:hypothetical protein
MSYLDINSTNSIPNIKNQLHVFGNFGGLVNQQYEHFSNLIAIQLCAVLFFALIYYLFMLDFNTFYIIPSDLMKVKKESYLNHKMLIAIFMSINFQTTTAYVDIMCKSIWVRSVITLQLVSTIIVTFLFLT